MKAHVGVQYSSVNPIGGQFMDEASMYIKLAQTVERLKGAGTWTDLQLGIMRAREAKLREQLNSLFSDMSLEDLSLADKIASKEVFKSPPPLPPAKPAKR